MSARFLEDDRLVELLVQLETEGLPPAESLELDALLEASPDARRDAFAPAAAALTLAAKLPAEPLPATLQARLVEQGRRTVQAVAAGKVVPLPTKAKREPVAGSPFGWYAAAAALILAVAAWWPKLDGETSVAVVTPPPIPTQAEQRAALVAAGAIRQAWSATEDPASAQVSGDVVWDPATQTGYMRFAGLPANDASRQQYQLWIFDGTRDDRFPVDGGVFDIPAGATEVVVPIHARLPVRQAALFAVTIEAPGGAVVSSRERIVALAQVARG